MEIRINLRTEKNQVIDAYVYCPFWRNSMGKMQRGTYTKPVELSLCVKCKQFDKFTTNYIYCKEANG